MGPRFNSDGDRFVPCKGTGFLIAAGLLALAGCAPALMRDPVPVSLTGMAEISGFQRIRYWGDEPPADIEAVVEERKAQILETRAEIMQGGKPNFSFLALSGGGGDGAFGAGLLAGWTKAGTRPEFEVVTGVSTGALIAPFAFLGSAYDRDLEAVYTSYNTSELATLNVIPGLLGGLALTEDSGLKDLVAGFVTEDLLRKVAAEHRKGRRMLVGTTDLDAQRPVIWDMGAIAASGQPEALQLFRDVLLASASIPGVFPPVFIRTLADGQAHDEMHVDGGTTGQVFFLPPEVIEAARKTAKGSWKPHYTLYVINNGRITPEWQAVPASTLSIAKRSLFTLIKSQGVSNLHQIYESATRAKVDFNMAAIPADFMKEPKEPFDRDYMRTLFARGFELGSRGYPWAKSPPAAQRGG